MSEINDFLGARTYAFQYGHIARSDGEPVDQAASDYHMLVLYAPRPVHIWPTLPGSGEIGVQIVKLHYQGIPMPGRLNADMRGLSDVFTRVDTDPTAENGCAFYQYCKDNARACICLQKDARHVNLTDPACPAVARLQAAGTYKLQSIQTPTNKQFRNAADLKPLARYEKYYDLFPCHPELRRFNTPPLK